MNIFQDEEPEEDDDDRTVEGGNGFRTLGLLVPRSGWCWTTKEELIGRTLSLAVFIMSVFVGSSELDEITMWFDFEETPEELGRSGKIWR